ncbi:hypothetical protein ACFV1W_28095 [Kitasatospora sp. NPDC059648]|uniref:hypothetical protein n=1 Tax=Kitasatospora sp. NPDC059648 TaxID=3346894 RepID=UPI0036963B9D
MPDGARFAVPPGATGRLLPGTAAVGAAPVGVFDPLPAPWSDELSGPQAARPSAAVATRAAASSLSGGVAGVRSQKHATSLGL